MDLEDQWKIKRCVQRFGQENILVLLGCPDAESAGIQAETVTIGDPSLAGPLTGRPLMLNVYHILEEPIQRLIPPQVFARYVMSTAIQEIDVNAISQRMREVRARARSLVGQI